ncbi:hypothetical protein GNI_012650 [Gregarina niphandrodes]|uniref:Uncharacterized protein n=1 Tax=Gregarina niphandrodes TaxID=110365 RepID=A0A023BCR1_GRENI|nr:hypothetical protein GNI_012650 [Gregarina niphandrodes]EZG84534.1 hypothetical protein GNI_012650 [Gregarina niphandrodes]|eukprot:XP_011128862.1 hypothetical protein GNI_012650 [Gregarina niphandrodes]
MNGQVVELDFYVLPTPMMKYPMLGLPALQQLHAAVDLASERLATHHGDLLLVQDPDLVVCDSRVSALQEAEESFTLSQIEERINPSLSDSQRQDILKLLTACDSTWTATKVGRCKVLEHQVDTGDRNPPSRAPGDAHRDKRRKSNDRYKTCWPRGPSKTQTAHGGHK